MSSFAACVRRCALVLLLPPAAAADAPAKVRPDPIAPLAAAAERASASEISRIAERVAPEELSACIENAPRARKLACIEASCFSSTSLPVARALLTAAAARDRAVASAAAQGLVRQLASERLAAAELTPLFLQEIRTGLLAVAGDQRLGPDVRAAALRGLRSVPPSDGELTRLLADPDARIRREIVGMLLERGGAKRELGEVAAGDSDVPTAALAAACLCESGNVPAAVDARVRAWLGDAALGPATLGPLITCARARPTRAPFDAWVMAARLSRREDIRVLASVGR